MPIEDELENDRKVLEELLASENQETVEETPDQEESNDEPEEKSDDESKPEEKSASDDGPEEQESDASVHARLRREKRERAALEKQNQELNERLSRLEAAQNAPIADPEQIEVPQLPPIVNEMAQQYHFEQASREFVAFENQFKATVTDYDGVAQAYTGALFQSIRLHNPRLSMADVGEKVKQAVLYKAADFARQGLNPAEEMYHEAKELGIQPYKAPEKEAKEEPKRPDLDKIAANKSRNAGFAGATGNGKGGQLTALAASELPVHEFAKLSAAEKKRIFDSLR